MTIKLLALILGSITLSALAQLLLKHGMSSAAVQLALEEGAVMQMARTIGTNVHVLMGLLLYAAGAVAWLFVLARTDVSIAYPFVGLGFVLTMLLGWAVLHEPVTSVRVAGTLMVVAGVYLIART